MNLVLKYYGSGLDGRSKWLVLPIIAESKEAACAVFREGLTQARELGELFFECWGERHYLHNFMAITNPQRLRMAQATMPEHAWFEVVHHEGQLYVLRFPKFLTVDEWFAEAVPAVKEAVCG